MCKDEKHTIIFCLDPCKTCTVIEAPKSANMSFYPFILFVVCTLSDSFGSSQGKKQKDKRDKLVRFGSLNCQTCQAQIHISSPNSL